MSCKHEYDVTQTFVIPLTFHNARLPQQSFGNIWPNKVLSNSLQTLYIVPCNCAHLFLQENQQQDLSSVSIILGQIRIWTQKWIRWNNDKEK